MTEGQIARAHRKLSELLARETGQQLLANRHWRVEMALKPILRKHSIPDIDMLATILDGGGEPELLKECMESMVNNETCFFRDQANFALLTGPVMDSLRAARANTKRLRIWSAACSTGQEPHSLAMSFLENAEKWRGWNIQILATDISTTALAKARKGQYSQFEIQRGLPVMLMLKYFDQVDGDWVAKPEVRKMVTFAQHNQLDSPRHMGQFDLILCRNMLMYLCDDKRREVLEQLASALTADGILMLGAAETVIGQTEKFVASREFRGFYQRTVSGNVAATGQQRLAI
ncbi:CheR family methyltransferase [Sphingorhabdus sp.]|jgi:chemotaxis protein methyltransferase CheR|uniref:CheR family methyltransferase n=1 Tax=Sphingorhabdus sp. TaxID=1902408 RepID=UPI002C373942|nr:CheR family methyltransferase [Sphingorhabdus sp.]HMT41283.1 CheR family methyltransferase [Sphingorhabdus sp.]